MKLLQDSARHCVLLRHRRDNGAIHLAVKSVRDAEKPPRALMRHCESLPHVVHAPAERALLGVVAVQVAGLLRKLPNALIELFLPSARCFVDLGANDGHDAVAQILQLPRRPRAPSGTPLRNMFRAGELMRQSSRSAAPVARARDRAAGSSAFLALSE